MEYSLGLKIDPLRITCTVYEEGLCQEGDYIVVVVRLLLLIKNQQQKAGKQLPNGREMGEIRGARIVCGRVEAFLHDWETND